MIPNTIKNYDLYHKFNNFLNRLNEFSTQVKGQREKKITLDYGLQLIEALKKIESDLKKEIDGIKGPIDTEAQFAKESAQAALVAQKIKLKQLLWGLLPNYENEAKNELTNALTYFQLYNELCTLDTTLPNTEQIRINSQNRINNDVHKNDGAENELNQNLDSIINFLETEEKDLFSNDNVSRYEDLLYTIFDPHLKLDDIAQVDIEQFKLNVQKLTEVCCSTKDRRDNVKALLNHILEYHKQYCKKYKESNADSNPSLDLIAKRLDYLSCFETSHDLKIEACHKIINDILNENEFFSISKKSEKFIHYSNCITIMDYFRGAVNDQIMQERLGYYIIFLKYSLEKKADTIYNDIFGIQKLSQEVQQLSRDYNNNPKYQQELEHLKNKIALKKLEPISNRQCSNDILYLESMVELLAVQSNKADNYKIPDAFENFNNQQKEVYIKLARKVLPYNHEKLHALETLLKNLPQPPLSDRFFKTMSSDPIKNFSMLEILSGSMIVSASTTFAVTCAFTLGATSAILMPFIPIFVLGAAILLAGLMLAAINLFEKMDIQPTMNP